MSQGNQNSAKAKQMHTNRLAAETSPYLLQHQHNPVDWYPWGAEAFEAARGQNKPIFLSVGYSTCYWCHVMERQCFENESIAGAMNELFINIKVDREERPDVDSLYMTAVQVLTRQGGWPMSVFLTPDLRPFHGGTYFPPEDAYGRPGFPTLLRAIHDAWLHRPAEVEQAANQLSDILRQLAVAPLPKRPVRVDQEFVAQKITESTLDYDAVHGGFGGAPKFPRETLLELLLIDRRHAPNAKRMQMLRHTLDALANGGIRDHLGGGFHRYSTDRQWLVPHFEIMLYDNAMLAWCYVEAHRQTGEQRYARVARGILDFVLREMTSPDGAFYTAFDAEVDAQEGLNYLWTRKEIDAVLREGASDFCDVYGVSDGPNFVDPHHGGGTPDKNILYLPNGPERENDPLIVSARAKLYEARQRRKKPLLDTKILTSWNALMIRAFAYAGEIFREQCYKDAASRAADYLLTMHRFPPAPDATGQERGAGEDEQGASVAEASANAGLLRTSRDGQARYHAFLDDYAFLAQALLALHDATAEPKWLREARNIVRQMQHRFGDETGGFFYTDLEASELLVRQKIATDSPLPAGNAVAAMVLTKLGELDEARKTLAAFTAQMDAHGEAMSSMLQAVMEFLHTDGPFTVSAASSDAREDPSSQIVRIQHQWIDPLSLILTLKIEPGFHLHAHEASAEFIGTDLFLYDEMSAAIDYPPGEEKTFAFADRPIRVYEGEVKIAVCFARPVVGKAIAMVLRYQACDASSCRAPVSQKFEVAVA